MRLFNRQVFAGLLWEPRDLWIGVYWTRLGDHCLAVYVCLLPLVPIRLLIWRDIYHDEERP